MLTHSSMTKITRPVYNFTRNWWIVDLKNRVPGRVATHVARILMGKHKPVYSPGVDCGDYVIAVNAAHIKLTGKKSEQKIFRHFSGYQGGLKELKYSSLIEKNPEFIFYLAVKRMLPKNKLGKRMLTRLRIYRDSNYKEVAQKPQPLHV